MRLVSVISQKLSCIWKWVVKHVLYQTEAICECEQTIYLNRSLICEMWIGNYGVNGAVWMWIAACGLSYFETKVTQASYLSPVYI